jgi:hypothetical protein
VDDIPRIIKEENKGAKPLAFLFLYNKLTLDGAGENLHDEDKAFEE